MSELDQRAMGMTVDPDSSDALRPGPKVLDRVTGYKRARNVQKLVGAVSDMTPEELVESLEAIVERLRG